MWYIIEAVLCILAGGYGGYRWGASAQAKAQVALNKVEGAVKTL